MACHTITESAKLTNKSRRTIQRYVKSGKLSVKNNQLGYPVIDTSELIRIFGSLSHLEPDDLSRPVAVTDYEKISELISNAIIESNKPLLKKIGNLTEQLQFLTNRLEKPLEKEDEVKIVEEVSVHEQGIPPVNYLDDIPTFGKSNN